MFIQALTKNKGNHRLYENVPVLLINSHKPSSVKQIQNKISTLYAYTVLVSGKTKTSFKQMRLHIKVISMRFYAKSIRFLVICA